ncbi:hypothetical protein, partial [Solemya velum gill symbiont]|uniref:hypothetical protein n=1 Tax=Solemya velum gill symbiont TaxID=2340 RepID=UPI000997F7E6
MKFKKINIGNHSILHIQVVNDLELLKRAEQFARSKSPNVKTGDPSGRERKQSELFSQNFLGSLADIVCAEVLTKYMNKHNHPIEVLQYDEVRTDNFLNPDMYDIKLINNNNEYIVEVRSSACIYLSLEAMIMKWQVLGPYSSETKGGFEDDKAFYIRPLYHLKSYEKNRTDKHYTRSSGIDLVKSGDLNLYIVGGATSEIMNKKGRNESGEELKQGKSEFKVVDIKDALDANDFLKTVSETITSDNNY